jgi:signal recognition particle GTPase
MIFGGGVSYLTSKMKNLSKHKQLIEQGFDLQFRMLQKQEMKTILTIIPSPSFKELYEYLDHRSKKLVKVVIGTNGMGFTTNLQEWVRSQN